MLALIGVAVALFLVALDGGSFGLESRSMLAIVVWWLILLGTVSGSFSNRVSGSATAAALLLLGFAVWAGFSAFWAESPERAMLDLGRNLFYAGLFVVVVVGAAPRAKLAAWGGGLGLGIAAVGLLALAGRLFPGLTPAGQLTEFLPLAGSRLSYPLNYWNALAALVAIGLPILLAVSVHAQAVLVRAASVTVVPPLVIVIYLTSSRGGSIAAVIGVLLWIVLTSRRWAATATLLVACAGSAAAVAVIRARPQLVDGGAVDVVESQGRSAAVLLIVLSLATGLATAVGSLLLARRSDPPRAFGVAATMLGAAGILALVLAADPIKRLDEFTDPTTVSSRSGGFVETHLLSVNGSGRWEHWNAAVEQFRESPLIGHGSGSYEAWWAEHGSLSLFVTEAHSLYLEVLGELGLVGFALLFGAFAIGVCGAVRLMLRDSTHERGMRSGLLAGFGAFAIAAAVDWMWEVPSVTMAGLSCLALALSSPIGRRAPGRATLAVIPVALAAIVLAALPALSANRLDASRAAFAQGDSGAARGAARDARELAPWAASPYVQLALIEEERDTGAARGLIDIAIEQDPSDWRLWLVAARLHVKAGAILEGREALARARRLNPRSPIFRR